MITKKRVLVLVCVLFVATMGLAQNPSLGTWKLNEAKSRIPAGAAKNMTVKYEAAGDSIKATVDGVDGKGKAFRSEWTGKFDGKDYPVTDDPASDTRAIKQVNDRTFDLTVKKAGKVTVTGRIVVAADGKSRTLTTSGTDGMGMKMESVSVYDKQ
jgi:hypothetical protein